MISSYIEDLEDKGLRFRTDIKTNKSIFISLSYCFSYSFLNRELELGRMSNDKYEELINKTKKNLSSKIYDIKIQLENYEKIRNADISNNDCSNYSGFFEDEKGEILSYKEVDELLKKYNCIRFKDVFFDSKYILDTCFTMLEFKFGNLFGFTWEQFFKQEQEKTKELEQQDFVKQEYINHIFQDLKEISISEIENYFQWGISYEDKKAYCIELYEILCKIFIPKTELTENEKEIFRNLIKNLIDKYLTQDKKDLFKNSNYYFIYESFNNKSSDIAETKENETEIDLYKKLIESKILYKNEYGIYATESSPNIAKWIVGAEFNKNNKRQCSAIEKRSLLETASKIFDMLKEKKSDLTFTKENLKKEFSNITEISL